MLRVTPFLLRYTNMEPTEFRTDVIHPIECAKEAWALIKPNYWLLFAIFLVGALVGAITLYVLIGAMLCGIMYCYLRQIDGYAITFEDLWKGLSFFWPSLPVTLLIVIPTAVWFVVLFTTMYAPIIMAAVMGDRLSGDEMMSFLGGALLVDSVVAIAMVCIHTLLTFSFPLVVDRGLTGIKPAVVSAKAVWGNLKGICGLVGVNFVLALAGELLCGVGLYLTIPIILATNMVAYRKIFPAATVPHLNRPPSNAYSGL